MSEPRIAKDPNGAQVIVHGLTTDDQGRTMWIAEQSNGNVTLIRPTWITFLDPNPLLK
jgi:hypothetical protein